MNDYLRKLKMSNGHMTILQFVFGYGILHTISIDSYVALGINGILLLLVTKIKSL